MMYNLKKIRVIIRIGKYHTIAKVPCSFKYLKELADAALVECRYHDLSKQVIELYSRTAQIDMSPIIYIGVDAQKKRLKSLEWQTIRELLNER